MRDRKLKIVAAIAAGMLGTVAASWSQAATGRTTGDGTYRLVRNAEGGNAQNTYNFVRTDAGRVANNRPYALTGRNDRPTRYKAVTNVGGNARTVNLVPQAEW